ncbi:MAG: DUF2167 domain-containing protein [Gammaproteobacteria bacterium]|nr:DUF2167 domain-containing protein [Gammaproteobacteria bacterium]
MCQPQRLILSLAVIVFTLNTSLVLAQDNAADELSAEEQARLEQLRTIVDSLDRQSGDIQLGDDLARLVVPRDFYFLGPGDAEKVLVDVWGNPPGQDVLGMLFPSRYSPLDYDSWAVTIDYVDDGYVSDEDAVDIDYDDLLVGMQKDTLDSNADREAAGYGAIELLGWAEPPYYDATQKKLYWAKELRFAGAEETTLNYEIRALGRRGMLMMTFIASTPQLSEINAYRNTVLAMAEFNEGGRYADFDPSIDKVAAYGIGALVAGKLAAKAGFFAVGLVLLKKFGIFLLLGLGAFGRKLKGLFTTDKLEPK